MNAKAIYLAIVFASPLAVLAVPIDLFQSLWVPLYVPVGAVVAWIAYLRPRPEMFVWIFLTPIVFWLLVIVAFPLILMGAPSFAAWGQGVIVVVVVATPAGFLIGAYTSLLAVLLFALFRSKGWLA